MQTHHINNFIDRSVNLAQITRIGYYTNVNYFQKNRAYIIKMIKLLA